MKTTCPEMISMYMFNNRRKERKKQTNKETKKQTKKQTKKGNSVNTVLDTALLLRRDTMIKAILIKESI